MITQLRASPTRTAVSSIDSAWLEWRLEPPVETSILTVADLAECACPELCDRDHDND